MKRTIMWVLLSVLILGAAGEASAREWIVRKDGTGDKLSITDAMTSATQGDVIRVTDQGTYLEEVAITTDTTIISDPPGTTITSNPLSDAVVGRVLVGTNDLVTTVTGFNIKRVQINAVTNLDMTISDCTIDETGGPVNTDCLLSQCKSGTLRVLNSQILNGVRHGVQLATNSDSQMFIMRDSVIRNAGSTGLLNGRGNNVLIENCEITGCVINGVQRSTGSRTGSHTMTIRDTLIENNGGNGISITATWEATGTWPTPADTALILENNIIRSNGATNGQGVFISAVTSDANARPIVTMRNNIIQDGSNKARTLVNLQYLKGDNLIENNLLEFGAVILNIINPEATASIKVQHNTIVNGPAAATSGIRMDVLSGRPVEIRNNIITGSATGVLGIAATGNEGVVLDYNLVNADTGGTTVTSTLAAQVGANNKIGLNPGFVLPSSIIGAGNYRLTASSAAVDAAVALTPAVTTDLDGKTRPLGLANDFGCYEFELITAVPRGSWLLY